MYSGGPFCKVKRCALTHTEVGKGTRTKTDTITTSGFSTVATEQ